MNLEQSLAGVSQEEKVTTNSNEQSVTPIVELYHGSPHSLDHFSLEHIGTGEGGKVYGIGIYLSELKEVADVYAKHRKKNFFFGKKGSIYKVGIIKDNPEWLQWDKSISDEQLEKIKGGLEEASLIDIHGAAEYHNLLSAIENKNNGKSVYKALTGLMGSDKAASELLAKIGIDGVKYQVDDIADKYQEHKGKSNYVVFDPSLLSVIQKAA